MQSHGRTAMIINKSQNTLVIFSEKQILNTLISGALITMNIVLWKTLSKISLSKYTKSLVLSTSDEA